MSNEVLLFIGILAVWGIWMIMWVYPHWLFRRTFGEAAPASQHLKSLFQHQFVDPKLCSLARDMDQAFQTQNNQLRAINERSVDYKQAAHYTYLFAQQAAMAKRNFWQAYNVANRFKFKMRPRYTDYL